VLRQVLCLCLCLCLYLRGMKTLLRFAISSAVILALSAGSLAFAPQQAKSTSSAGSALKFGVHSEIKTPVNQGGNIPTPPGGCVMDDNCPSGPTSCINNIVISCRARCGRTIGVRSSYGIQRCVGGACILSNLNCCECN